MVRNYWGFFYFKGSTSCFKMVDNSTLQQQCLWLKSLEKIWISDTWLNSKLFVISLRLITPMSTCIFTVCFANLWIWVVEILLFDFLLFIRSCGMYCQCAIINIIICYKDLSKSMKKLVYKDYDGICCFKFADDETQTLYVVVISRHHGSHHEFRDLYWRSLSLPLIW